MGRFNLENYETVKERKKKFYEKHPEGRILVEFQAPIEMVTKLALFKASVFVGDTLVSTGYAFEERDTELKQGRNGEYEGVNFSSWVENCEESAIGRALDNYGFAGNNKCSREEMKRVERVQAFTPPSSTETTPSTKAPTTSAFNVPKIKSTPGVVSDQETTEPVKTPAFKAPVTSDVQEAAPAEETPKTVGPTFKAPAFGTPSPVNFKTNAFAKYKTK